MVVRGDSWLAMCCAASSVPLFFRYAVMPVARKVWFPILVLMPVQRVRRPRVGSNWQSKIVCKWAAKRRGGYPSPG